MAVIDEERATRPAGPADPTRRDGDESGPSRPDVQRPDRSDLLKRMKKVDPDTARKYRQRSGE
ncbi:MAG TPA: ubiquitin-like protein UBact [Capsulimonadaceae bacterium]